MMADINLTYNSRNKMTEDFTRNSLMSDVNPNRPNQTLTLQTKASYNNDGWQ